MFKKLIVLIILPVLLYSCREQDPGKNASITGSFPVMAGDKVYLEELEPLQTVLLDSAVASKDGSFQFDLAIIDAGFYLLRTTRENQLLLLLNAGEHVTVASSSGKFDTDVSLEGSPGSSEILDFEKFMQLQRVRIDSLGTVYNEHRGEPGFTEIRDKLDSLYQSYVADQRAYVFNFIDAHPGSLASLIMIYRKLGQAKVIDEEEDFRYLHRIDSLLQLSHPENKHTMDHHERVAEIRGRIFDQYVIEEKLSPGKKAPDVVINDTTGNPLSLKSFTGKRVIIYFWAGWDARSRLVNQKLADLYPGLKERNVEVLGISLDENATVWKGAVRLDQLQWPQGSELKGYQSGIVKTYNIQEKLPYFYLIDEQQRIQYKNGDLDSVLVRLK